MTVRPADENVEALVKQIKDASAILADWAEEDAGFSSVDIDEARAEILSAAELLASRLFVSVEGQAAAEQRTDNLDDAVRDALDVLAGATIHKTMADRISAASRILNAALAAGRAGEATEEKETAWLSDPPTYSVEAQTRRQP